MPLYYENEFNRTLILPQCHLFCLYYSVVSVYGHRRNAYVLNMAVRIVMSAASIVSTRAVGISLEMTNLRTVIRAFVHSTSMLVPTVELSLVLHAHLCVLIASVDTTLTRVLVSKLTCQ